MAAVVLIVGASIIFALGSALFGERPTPSQLPEIPEDVPPAAGAPVDPVDIHAPGRTADQLELWAQTYASVTSIPVTALKAYGNAAAYAAEFRPACQLSWTTLAGIGEVESHHGSYGGAVLSEDGSVSPAIIGVQLDGSPGFAEILDTDGGALDGDTRYDRAVGPMQFLPSVWQTFGVDANGDGIADPQNIDDAAASAAMHLCQGGRDLSTPEGWTEAILGYNPSQRYVLDVRDAAALAAMRSEPGPDLPPEN